MGRSAALSPDGRFQMEGARAGLSARRHVARVARARGAGRGAIQGRRMSCAVTDTAPSLEALTIRLLFQIIGQLSRGPPATAFENGARGSMRPCEGHGTFLVALPRAFADWPQHRFADQRP